MFMQNQTQNHQKAAAKKRLPFSIPKIQKRKGEMYMSKRAEKISKIEKQMEQLANQRK